MTNELTDLTNIPAPTLTLDPVSDGEVAEVSIIEVDPPAAPSLADSLSAEELAQVDAFAQQIDIANSQQVLTFGAGAQKKMASFSETALAKVRTQDLGEAGDLIAGVVTELKNFDVDDDDKGFFGLFKKSANKITSLKARYDTAEANVDKIAKTLEGHQVQLMKDAATLDKLYELNLTYFKELTMYLLAGLSAWPRCARASWPNFPPRLRPPAPPRTPRRCRNSPPPVTASRRSCRTWICPAPWPCKWRRRSVLCRTTRCS